MTASNDPQDAGAPADGEAIAAKLDEARALIERGWTQCAYARDSKGRDVKTLPNGAYELSSFCAVGALRHVRAPLWNSFTALQRIVGTPFISSWNDAPERTQAEVIDAFKRAAAIARSEGASA